MTFEDILVAIEAPIGVITFNRPSVLNALRTNLLKEVSPRSPRWNATTAFARSS